MNKNTKRWLERQFPWLDCTTRPTKENVIRIVSTLYDDINVNNKDFTDALFEAYGDEYLGRVETRKAVMAVLNPSGKAKSSKLKKEYWINRGWDMEYASNAISRLQRERSPSSLVYWVSRGVSETEAKQRISEFQSNNGKKFWEVAKSNGTHGRQSQFNKDFWMARGYTVEAACERIAELQSKNSKRHWSRLDAGARRKVSALCVEHWADKGGVAAYERFMSSMSPSNNYSKSSEVFFDRLDAALGGGKSYYGAKEFGKYIIGVGYTKYDYVNLTYGVVVEYDSAYWHSSDHAKERDRVKEDFIRSLGFRVYRTSFEEDTQNPNLHNELAGRIMYEAGI